MQAQTNHLNYVERGCAYAAGSASEKAQELLAQGWKLIRGRETHEVSRALGLAWPVATLDMRAPDKSRHHFRFVGQADNQIFLYSK